MEENKQNQPVENAPTQHPPTLSPEQQPQDNNNSKIPSIIRISLAVLCFLFGTGQILLSIGFVIFILPQLSNLNSSLAIQNTNQYISYVAILILLVFGGANIFYGIKILKNEKFFVRALIVFIVSLIAGGIFVATMVLNVLNPIYDTIETVQNSQNSPVTP